MSGDLDQPAESEGVFEPQRRLKLDSDRAVWRELGEEVVVLDVETATYLSLNGSGGALLKRLDAGATPNELVAELVSAYGVAEVRASKDVEDFLHALRDRSLLLMG
jgi:hypothetical protein